MSDISTNPAPMPTPPPVPAPTIPPSATPSKGTFGKILKFIGAATLTAMVIFGIFIALSIKDYGKYQKESKEYVDTEVQKIVRDWNEDELLAQADSQFLTVTPKETLDKLFDYLSKNLGDFKSYGGSTLGHMRSDTGSSGKVILVVYASNVTFEKGPAQILTTVQYKNGKWTIVGFQVNSEAFLK